MPAQADVLLHLEEVAEDADELGAAEAGGAVLVAGAGWGEVALKLKVQNVAKKCLIKKKKSSSLAMWQMVSGERGSRLSHCLRLLLLHHLLRCRPQGIP